MDVGEGHSAVEDHAGTYQGLIGSVDQEVIFTEVEAGTKSKVSMDVDVVVLFTDELLGAFVCLADGLVDDQVLSEVFQSIYSQLIGFDLLWFGVHENCARSHGADIGVLGAHIDVYGLGLEDIRGAIDLEFMHVQGSSRLNLYRQREFQEV